MSNSSQHALPGFAGERVHSIQRIASHAEACGAVREGNEQQKRRGEQRGARSYGLTPVNFSAQPEPFLSLKPSETSQNVPQNVITTSRKVDERKGLPLVHFSAQPQPFLSPKSIDVAL
jgi:hypothetical protein